MLGAEATDRADDSRIGGDMAGGLLRADIGIQTKRRAYPHLRQSSSTASQREKPS